MQVSSTGAADSLAAARAQFAAFGTPGAAVPQSQGAARQASDGAQAWRVGRVSLGHASTFDDAVRGLSMMARASGTSKEAAQALLQLQDLLINAQRQCLAVWAGG